MGLAREQQTISNYMLDQLYWVAYWISCNKDRLKEKYWVSPVATATHTGGHQRQKVLVNLGL